MKAGRARNTERTQYQLLKSKGGRLTTKKRWFGQLVALAKFVVTLLARNKSGHSHSDDTFLSRRVLRTRTLSIRQSGTHTHSSPVKADLGFTPKAFEMMTLYKQFPCQEAETLARMLEQAQSMSTKGGLENILAQIFKIQSQNALFKSGAEKMLPQHCHLTTHKGKTSAKPIKPDEIKDFNPKEVVDLKELRLETTKMLESQTKVLLEALSPKKELDEYASLAEQYSLGIGDKSAIRNKAKKILDALNKKEKNYREIRFSSSPNTRETVSEWIKQIETMKRDQFHMRG